MPNGDLMIGAPNGKPPFKSVKALGEKTFRDLYYDQSETLIRAGIYVRQRNGRWETKVRQGGDYNNSQFEELTDVDSIGQLVQRVLKTDVKGKPNFGLLCLADITTRRRQWLVDEEFVVVLDEAHFGHTVGEVELQGTFTFENDDEKKALMLSMDKKIAHFLEQYSWAFIHGEPKGKLTAYFELKMAGLIE